MHMPTSDALPMGLSMALARNPAALSCFTNLSPAEQRAVIDGTHRIRSAAEMRRYVDALVSGGKPE